MRTEPTLFYAHLNWKRLTKAAITSIKSVTSSKILRDPDRVTEELAVFFATTFVQENEGPLPYFKILKQVEDIPSLVLRLDDVGKKNQKMLQKPMDQMAYILIYLNPYRSIPPS